MNKKEMTIFILLFLASTFIIIPFGNADEYTNSSINVSVSISEPIARIEISPDKINLGEVTPGYYTNYTNITFVNKGTLNVSITPRLDNDASKIFTYLEFNTASCSITSTVWHNLEYYNTNKFLSIKKIDPTTLEQYQDFACLRLNLAKYNDSEVTSDLDLSTNLIFWIMPA
jgi:hypothetical protein